jgi:hypothetical protein
MGQPIENQASQAVNGKAASSTPPAGTEYLGSEVSTMQPMSKTPVEDYIQAMHLFIEAQMQMIHSPDVPRFASAQESYIRAQIAYVTAMLGQPAA